MKMINPRIEFSSTPSPDEPTQIKYQDIASTVVSNLLIVRRHLFVIVACVVVAVALGLTYYLLASPKYTGEVELLIDMNPASTSIFNTSSAPQADPSLDTSAVDSQVEIIGSAKIYDAVIQQLNLVPDGYGKPNAIMDFVNKYLDVKALLGVPPLSQEDQDRKKREDTFEWITKNLTVKRTGRTYVLSLQFVSKSAETAANVANAFAKAYLDDQFDANFEASRRASDWLVQRIQELKDKQLQADLAVQKFTADNNLVQGADGTLLSQQQASDVSGQLSQAKEDTAKAQAKFNRVTQIIASGQIDAAVSESIANPNIIDLRNKYLTTAKTEADLSARLGRDHIQPTKLRQEMAEYQKLIFDELSRIAQGYKSELDIATTHQKALEDSLSQQMATSAKVNKSLVTLRELERERDTFKSLYENLLQRYQESVQKQSFPISQARVISNATPPMKPSSPKILIVLAIAILAGGGIGSGIAAARELRDRGFHTGQQVRDLLGLEFLGMLPRLSRRQLVKVRRSRKNPNSIFAPTPIMSYAVHNLLSSFTETLRSAKVAIDHIDIGKQSRVIGIVSVLPDEGKSTVSKNFASLSAHLGVRTILIDGDLRNPGLSRATAPAAKWGLTEVLTDRCTWQDALLVEEETGLHFIPARFADDVTQRSGLLASDAMAALVRELQAHYAHVVIDLPPIGPVIDVKAAEKLFDHFIFVVQWGSTSRELIATSLEADGAIYDKCVGVVLNGLQKNRLNLYDTHSTKEAYYNKYTAHYLE